MIREVTTCSEMLQWPLTLWPVWLCVTFFKDIRNYVPIFKTCVMRKQIVNFNVWQLQILQAETKNQGNRTNMGQEDFTVLTLAPLGSG